MSSHSLRSVAVSRIIFCFAAVVCVAFCRAESANAADPDLEKGKGIYNGAGACFSCHGPEGKGDGIAAAALNPKPRSLADGSFKFDTDADGKMGTETDIFNIVTNGAVKYGGSPLMAGRPDLPEADRKALVKFVLSLKK